MGDPSIAISTERLAISTSNEWMATCLVSLPLVGFIRSFIITYVASLGQWYCYYSITIIICIN